ncbi:hypothetical protein ASG87_06600 [Frateuria sp. Soil773]|uniref:hypothetical protein n=1 Tax=Frateuria sp. Soil773 TaxID=1736407 RepID=UPI0006F3A7B8|nr:hypothetical protein [Frateuria sp. Soil773]KRE89193.1 hypothetical protein ASG87_06600 [Frateuria sp. Soil773]
MIRTIRMVTLWAVFAGLAAGFAGCRRTPDEVRVREALAAASQAAEAGDASAMAASLSEDFDGNDGAMQRRDLTNLLRMIRLRGERVGVALGPVDAERRGERIVASFTATLSSGGKLLPAQLGVYRIETAWRREGGDWVCYSAHWTRPL